MEAIINFVNSTNPEAAHAIRDAVVMFASDTAAYVTETTGKAIHGIAEDISVNASGQSALVTSIAYALVVAFIVLVMLGLVKSKNFFLNVLAIISLLRLTVWLHECINSALNDGSMPVVIYLLDVVGMCLILGLIGVILVREHFPDAAYRTAMGLLILFFLAFWPLLVFLFGNKLAT